MKYLQEKNKRKAAVGFQRLPICYAEEFIN